MKIQLIFVTLFLVFAYSALAQVTEPEHASDITAVSGSTQTPDEQKIPEQSEAKDSTRSVKLPTIPDYLPPNEKALFRSAYDGDFAGVQAAIDKGASINIADQKKRTALMLAASNGHTAIVEYLISEGADINARDDENQTALMYASKRSFNKTAAVLLKNGAEVNVQSRKKGVSALMLAAVWDNVELVNMLLERGADANLEDAFGRTAEVLAKLKGNAAVVEILSSSTTIEPGS